MGVTPRETRLGGSQHGLLGPAPVQLELCCLTGRMQQVQDVRSRPLRSIVPKRQLEHVHRAYPRTRAPADGLRGILSECMPGEVEGPLNEL